MNFLKCIKKNINTELIIQDTFIIYLAIKTFYEIIYYE